MLQLNKEKRQQLTKDDQELIMKLSPIYTARLDEARQEGIQQGVQQGIQQGVQQEATSMIIRQLKRKVGELSPSLEAKIIGLPISTLEDLSEALLDFNSIDELNNWLSEN